MILNFGWFLSATVTQTESSRQPSPYSPDEQLEFLITSLASPQHDASAMEELYERIRVPVYAYALSLVKNPYDAEDILHDTLLSVYHAAHSYEPLGKPMAWILTIARHHGYGLLRQRRHLADIPEDALDTYVQDKPTVTPEDRIVLEQCLTALSDTERQIVVMHAVAGMKHRHIAELLQLPLSTVLSKYNRAIKKIRKKLSVSPS